MGGVKGLRGASLARTARVMSNPVGGMMSIFQRPQAQKPDEELIATVEDMNAAVDAANMAKNALNSALIETVAQGSLSMS